MEKEKIRNTSANWLQDPRAIDSNLPEHEPVAITVTVAGIQQESLSEGEGWFRNVKINKNEINMNS